MLRRVGTLAIAAGLLIWAAAPGAAWGQDNAGLDQYQENVPGAGGGNGSQFHEGGGSQSGHGSLPPSTVHQLNQQGPDGHATAQTAEQTSPAGVPQGASTSGTNGGGGSAGSSGGGTATGGGGGSASSGGGSAGASTENGSGGTQGTGGDSGSGGSGVGELLSNTVSGSDSGGLGAALPIILALLLLSALGVVVARRRGMVGVGRH